MLSARSSFCLSLVVALALSGCPRTPQPLNLPPPVEVTTLGVGDVFEVRVVGEEKLPVQYTVAPDGTIDFPYIKRIKVAGLEPQEVQELVRSELVKKEIFTDPNVSLAMKEYNSKQVNVLGEVQHPGSIPMVSGMTLLGAISKAGGFNAMAKRTEVTIRRRVKSGTLAATISVEDIMENRIPDPLLQAGDSVNVPQKVY